MTGGIFLLLGSNLGDREKNLSDAAKSIGTFASVIRASSIYSTRDWGNTNQPDFLNQVIEIDTTLSALDLLNCTLKVEIGMGRARKEKWGPRTIDIDLLFYRDETIETGRLTVPHPEIQNRKFVLIPLRELAGDFVHPIFLKTISQLDDDCADTLEVKRWQPPHSEQSS
jgi:2-amino-4-hydroxy-6-hydroxymethyldihydropteridine diphosphokinase